MMKQILLQLVTLLALLWVPIATIAQSEYEVVLYPQHRYVEDFWFRLIEVIDARNDTSHVGEARVGAFNKRQPIVIRGGVSRAFDYYINESLETPDSALALRMTVLDFRLDEEVKFNTEWGRALLEARFDILDQDTNVHSSYTITSQVKESGMDVTSKHEIRAKDVIIQSLEQLVWRVRHDSSDAAINAEIAQKSQALGKIYQRSGRWKYEYEGRRYSHFQQMDFIIAKCDNPEVRRLYKKCQRQYRTSFVLGTIGGFFIGYPLGYAVFTGVLFVPMFTGGIFLSAASFIIDASSRKNFEHVIARYNALSL